MLVALEHSSLQRDMADTPSCPYSKSQIIDAGKTLSGHISASEARSEKILNAFRIARSWREACAYPMRRVRMELVAKVRSNDKQAISAARLKRMVSVRKKLRETHFTLYQMQDIGGCRVILEDIADLNIVLAPYLGGQSRYRIVRDDNHIVRPQATGYRSRHLIVKFQDDENPGFDRHFVEIQFRTRKQHSWATAVEAVGLVRNEDLKGGRGDSDWLRLFQIMAAEIAQDEGGAAVPYVSESRSERRKELVALNGKLNAVQSLDSYNRAIKHTENIYSFSSPYYLIEYDLKQMKVSVRPFNFASAGSQQYAAAESNQGVNSVLVEVDKVADLREAYPNYFLDVGVFVARLKRALRDDRIPIFDANWFEEFARQSGRLNR